MSDEKKRIIEQTGSTEIYDDDYFIKDSALHNTTKISQAVLKQEILKDVKGVVELTQAEYDALPSSKLTDGILYAIKDSEDIIGELESTILANLADEYDSTTSYAVGNYCIKDNVLYVCTATTTGTWDSTKWSAITVGDKLISLDADVATLLRDIISNGYTWSSTTHYAKNSIVIYNKAIYKCAVDSPTVGTFVDNEWFKTDAKSLIDNVEEMICGRYQPSSVGMTHKYYVGDLVWIYENYKKVIYIANTENQDSSWTEDHWDKVTDISGLSKYLVGLIAQAGQINDVQVKTTGDYESVVDENKVAKIDLSNMLIEKSVPNLPQSIATFNDGSDLPLKSLTASIVPVQSGSGDPSPTNVRPITGWTEEVITRCGKNWLPTGRGYNFLYNADVGTVLDVDTDTPDWIDDKNGEYEVTLSDWQRCGLLSNQLPIGETAYVRIKIVSGSPRVTTYTLDTDYRVIRKFSNYNPASDGLDYNTQIQLAENEHYVGVAIVGSNKKVIIRNPHIVLNTDEPYEPYAGTTTTIPFTDSQGQSVEVFGGSVDVVNGGEQQRTMAIVDMGTLAWAGTTNNRFVADLNDVISASGDFTDFMCEMFTPRASIENGSIWINNKKIYVVDTTHSTPTDFTNFVNGKKIVYPLATPTTFYTQPTSIKSLDGENNVFANTGDVAKLEYIANATDVIANLEARVTALES